MKIFGIILTLVVALLFVNCSSSKDVLEASSIALEEKPSFQLGTVYFQKWVAGIQGGGSGIHLYITEKTNRNYVVFDSAYFRGLSAKIHVGKIGYLASFKTPLNQKEDVVMDGDSNREYGNKLPKGNPTFPFKLQDNECVIQYTENGKTMYYKVTTVFEKQTEYYPSAPNTKEKQ